jgi:colanic acid biosynthesis protein WcaH
MKSSKYTIIAEKTYLHIKSVMPICCVDLLIRDEQENILMLLRGNEPAKNQWWFPGGRVFFEEERHEAATRKLKEECNLSTPCIFELKTYDVILPLPENNLSHAITTVFSIKVKGVKPQINLDHLHENHAWKKDEEWAAHALHPFILGVLSGDESYSYPT